MTGLLFTNIISYRHLTTLHAHQCSATNHAQPVSVDGPMSLEILTFTGLLESHNSLCKNKNLVLTSRGQQ